MNDTANNKLILKFSLDHKVTFAVADLLVALLVDEMEFGPLNEETQRREKDGWGIGTSLVVGITRVERPKWTEPDHEVAVQFEFGGGISRAQAGTFTALVSGEVGGSAWGIGAARILSVSELGFAK